MDSSNHLSYGSFAHSFEDDVDPDAEDDQPDQEDRRNHHQNDEEHRLRRYFGSVVNCHLSQPWMMNQFGVSISDRGVKEGWMTCVTYLHNYLIHPWVV